jgi:hypothetical protein
MEEHLKGCPLADDRLFDPEEDEQTECCCIDKKGGKMDYKELLKRPYNPCVAEPYEPFKRIKVSHCPECGDKMKMESGFSFLICKGCGETWYVNELI